MNGKMVRNGIPCYAEAIKSEGVIFVKQKEIEILIKHRLEQAREALDDAKYLIDGNRSPQSIVNRSYYAMFYATLALLQRFQRLLQNTLE